LGANPVKIQLPKPLPGWREFFGEVGIIVLGVLIALGIGEVADGLRWDEMARDSVRSIRAEWGQNGGVFEERVLVQPCLDRRLAELESIIREARHTGRLPDISEIGRSPHRPLTTDAWKQVTASETLLHIDANQVKLFTAGYSQVERYIPSALDEEDMWATLRVLEHSPGVIGETLLADAATTLARLKSRSSLNGLVAKQEFEAGRKIGIPASYYMIFDREGSRAEILDRLPARPICKPLLVDGMPFAANP
jgi:hypothetical protein